MAYILVDIPAEEAERAKSNFHRSSIKTVAHNALVTRLEGLRCELESAKGEKIFEAQAVIAEIRRWLAVIHQPDDQETKTVYENTPRP